MAYFINFVQYINCSTDTKTKIARIDAIIEALEDAELKGAVNADIEEYNFDDGQSKVRVNYRDLKSISESITALERRKNRLIQKCIGYRYNLMDGNVKIP